jgi:hypothetical protein
MTKALLEKSSVNILKQIISNRKHFSKEVYTILDSGKYSQILSKLSDLKITPFSTNPGINSAKLNDSPPVILSKFERIDRHGCLAVPCKEFNPLFGEGLRRGEGSQGDGKLFQKTRSLAYVLNMCVVLDTFDSSKLKTRIDLINGVRAEEAEEGGEEGETGDDERRCVRSIRLS